MNKGTKLKGGRTYEQTNEQIYTEGSTYEQMNKGTNRQTKKYYQN